MDTTGIREQGVTVRFAVTEQVSYSVTAELEIEAGVWELLADDPHALAAWLEEHESDWLDSANPGGGSMEERKVCDPEAVRTWAVAA